MKLIPNLEAAPIRGQAGKGKAHADFLMQADLFIVFQFIAEDHRAEAQARKFRG